MSLRWILALVLATGLLLAACGHRAKTPTPAPTRTPTPTVGPTATPTRTPTPTAAWTATPMATPTPTPPSTPAPTPGPAPTATPAWTPPASPTGLADFFAPGPGKELALTYCDTCHSVVFILIGRKSPDTWALFLRHHRDANNYDGAAFLTNMTDAELETLTAYISANFNLDVPAFSIPSSLLQGAAIPG